MADQEVFTDPAEIEHRIGATGTFSLHNTSGSVRVRGIDGDTARVIAQSSSGHGRPLPLVVRRTDGGLHIDLEQKSLEFLGFSFMGARGGVEFDVEVPRAARVEVKVVSADVEVAGLSGEQSYRSVSGDIEIVGHGGRVAVTSVSGDVELHADGEVEPTVNTTSGDVRLKAVLASLLAVRTVSGDVELRAGFAVGPLHTVESVSGDLTVGATGGLAIDVRRGMDMTGKGRRLVSGDGAAQLRFRSLSGDVHLDGAELVAAPREPVAEQREAAPAPQRDPQPERGDSLEILRALERGEIDVEEASRRLEGATNRA